MLYPDRLTTRDVFSEIDMKYHLTFISKKKDALKAIIESNSLSYFVKKSTISMVKYLLDNDICMTYKCPDIIMWINNREMMRLLVCYGYPLKQHALWWYFNCADPSVWEFIMYKCNTYHQEHLGRFLTYRLHNTSVFINYLVIN